jgi:hypothetical protein
MPKPCCGAPSVPQAVIRTSKRTVSDGAEPVRGTPGQWAELIATLATE